MNWPNNRLIGASWYVLSAFLAASIGSAPAAEAKPGAPTIVLEAHIGKRSPEVVAAMAPVLDELERHGFAARPESIERLLRGRAPKSGRLDEGKTIADIKQLIAVGRSAFDKARLEESESALRTAVALIKRNPALLVLDTNNESVTYSAFVALAMTLSKRGNVSEANSVMLDLLRVSSAPIPPLNFGPMAVELHTDAEKVAQSMGRGSLTISVSDERAMIFVDYTYRGLGKVALGDQLPGGHSVLVQVPGGSGLQYVRDVRPSVASKLDVDWNIESALHMDKTWAGFLLASETGRPRESFFASKLPHRFDGNDVIILFMQEFDGVPFVGGIQYPPNGDGPIVAFAPVSGGEALLRSLGTYLYNGTMAAGLRVPRGASSGDSPAVALQDSDTQRPTWAPTWVPTVVTATGALAVAVGAAAYVGQHFDPNNRPSDGTDGKNPLVGVMLGGGVVIGGGVYLWSRESLSASRITAGALGVGVASIAAGLELYLVDQDETGMTLYYRDSATMGLIAGATGIALAGTGLWLLHRERTSAASPEAAATHRSARVASWAPFVSTGSTQALLGCVGSF